MKGHEKLNVEIQRGPWSPSQVSILMHLQRVMICDTEIPQTSGLY